MKTYVIRKVGTNEMVGAYEGEDGKRLAEELVEIRNSFYPNAPHYVSVEII